MNFKHLLIAIDDAPNAMAAVEHASQLAHAFSSKITLASVVAVDPVFGVDFYKLAPSVTRHFFHSEEDAQRLLSEYQTKLRDQNLEVECKLTHDVHTAQAILNMADEVNADLIVLGSHQRAGLKTLVGNRVEQALLSSSPVPVLIVK